MTKIKRTERGWCGHFICGDRCRFRRNTLLTKGRKHIIISTVGNLATEDGEMDTIGHERYYETMAFRAVKVGAYWDADVSEEVPFESDWSICAKSAKKLPDDVDNKANDMHEAVVAELIKKLETK